MPIPGFQRSRSTIHKGPYSGTVRSYLRFRQQQPLALFREMSRKISPDYDYNSVQESRTSTELGQQQQPTLAQVCKSTSVINRAHEILYEVQPVIRPQVFRTALYEAVADNGTVLKPVLTNFSTNQRGQTRAPKLTVTGLNESNISIVDVSHAEVEYAKQSSESFDGAR